MSPARESTAVHATAKSTSHTAAVSTTKATATTKATTAASSAECRRSQGERCHERARNK